MEYTFSKMLQSATGFTPIQGNITGTCCMCGEHTTHGNKKKFGTNFTSGDVVSTGNCICEYCQHVVKNSNTYRRTMFLLTRNEFRKFKKDELEQIITKELPENEPFYIYTTRTWQKVGYILLNNYCNTNNKEYVVICDYDIIHVNQSKFVRKKRINIL